MTLLCSAALPCASARPAAEGGVDTAADVVWILARLARPAPMRTSFVELRDSKLLKSPLRLSGEYLRPADDTLVREVRSPYVEKTTIVSSGAGVGRATIERGGRTRHYSLSRTPALASLQSSFGALLSGDRVALEHDFAMRARGTRAQWTLALAPRDARLAARLKSITLFGRGAELRCIETVPTQRSEVQRTLLAGAARAAAGRDGAALAELCAGTGG